MSGYSRHGGYKKYSKGVAAGFEYDDSSDDEFMFGDDYVDEKPKPKGDNFDAANNANYKSKTQVSAPWLKGNTKSTAAPREKQNAQK